MQVLITTFGELKEHEFLDPRTAQVAIVDHIKQVIYVLLLHYLRLERQNAKAIIQGFCFYTRWCLGHCLILLSTYFKEF